MKRWFRGKLGSLGAGSGLSSPAFGSDGTEGSELRIFGARASGSGL